MRPPSQTPDQTFLQYHPNHWANSRAAQQATSDSNFVEDHSIGPSPDYTLPAQGPYWHRNEMEASRFPGHDMEQYPTTNMSRRSIDSACGPSPQPSPMLSSSSVSDGCSSTWPSPAASRNYSPDPHVRESYVEVTAWTSGNMGGAFQPFTSLSEVQRHPDAAPDYVPPAVGFPLYCQASCHGYCQPEQMQATSAAEGYWQAASNPYSLPRSAFEPSPTPYPAPESGFQRRRREREAALFQAIRKEPSESSPMDEQTASLALQPARINQYGSFPCPLVVYGCESSFLSKNEAKRHMTTQHLSLDVWRCDQCNVRDGCPYDFARADLFKQHLLRMHFRHTNQNPTAHKITRKKYATKGSEFEIQECQKILPSQTALREAESRCHIRVRDPPHRSGCPFCDTTFDGRDSWAKRTEHVNEHFAMWKREGITIPDPRTWVRDLALEEYLLKEGILVVTRRGLQLKPRL